MGRKSGNVGCGWLSSGLAAALWAGYWAAGAKPRYGAYGPRYRSGIAATAGTSLTSGKPTPRGCHAGSTDLVRRAKGEGQTSIVEALNCSLRQRCGVLVRKSCSFSKSLAMHTARIKFIIDKHTLPLK